jgi:hypothetical protein
MYFWVRNSEDGLYVEGPWDKETLRQYIVDCTHEGIRPQYRTKFVGAIPGEMTPPEHVCIIKGEIVVPQPVDVVTEWNVE